MTYKPTGRATSPLMVLLGILIWLTACAPIQQPSQGFIASTPAPHATAGPPPVDAKGTQSALNLQAAIVQATAQAGAIQATSGAATASWQAGQQATAAVQAERTWVVQGWTATAGAVQATATDRARATATAAYYPFWSATKVALSNRMSIEATRAYYQAKALPYQQAAPLAVLFVILFAVMVVAVMFGYAAFKWIQRKDQPEEVYYPPVKIAPPEHKPSLTVYTGDPGKWSRAVHTDLPCSTTDMLLVAYWVVVKEDRSLAINKWEKRGLSGPIDKVRDWALEKRYAARDNNNYVEFNDEGVAFLAALRGHEGAQPPSPVGQFTAMDGA